MSERVRLFGVDIDNVTPDEAVERVRALCRRAGAHYVATPNVDHVVRLSRDESFRAVYRGASLIVADGMPIVWASQLLGRRLKGRVTGADLVPMICRMAQQDGRSVYILGGQPGVAQQAAQRWLRQFPGLRVVGHYAPPIGFEHDPVENQRIVRWINGAKPDILFLALGSPKQERWVAQHCGQLEIHVALCIGAGIDFAAGTVRRAPAWMQRAGLEWLWRLAQEPGRLWKRYLVEDIAFVRIFMAEWWRLRVRRAETARV